MQEFGLAPWDKWQATHLIWVHDVSPFRVPLQVRDGCVWNGTQGRLWLGRTQYGENPQSQGHFWMLICKLRCGWVGKIMHQGLSLPLSWVSLIPGPCGGGAGKGADLFAWQVWSACVHLHCLLARSGPGEGGVGWGRRLVSIRTQIGKRNQIYTSRNKLTKTRDNWLTLTIQASQAYQLRGNMLLGGELINSLFPRPKHALALPLGLLSSTNTQFLQFIATSHKVEWGGGDPWMGFISLWLPKIGCNI